MTYVSVGGGGGGGDASHFVRVCGAFRFDLAISFCEVLDGSIGVEIVRFSYAHEKGIYCIPNFVMGEIT